MQGYLRVGLPLQLMLQYQWKAVVMSDADVVWLKHPVELLQMYPAADMQVSTDCLSAKAIAEGQPDVYRCGMQPGGWNSAWNSGIVGADLLGGNSTSHRGCKHALLSLGISHCERFADSPCNAVLL